ncbi:lytic murein transglycosylase [Gordonia sp. CPCC 205515]|uniref:lytic transglycosylase domain-containing protein n=1 Tax=Gordonia sp. CPCC 205515 TaxID=3140791 RepID=UPI003AF34D7A
MARVFRRSQGPRRGVPRRALTVGAGGALVGAMVLGAATSSAQGDTMAARTVVEQPTVPAVAVDIVPGNPVSLLGFAPPPKKIDSATDPAAVAPQFRISGDLPSGPLGIPGVVLQAYKLAANRVDAEEPQCKLPWFLLAGIGRIESNHASNGSVDQYGTTINPILGPVLDGSLPGNEVITDGRGGHVSAMGPMQFIPSTWARWGTDANGDGKADPHNVFDATYSAGRYLCAGITDIMASNNKVAAVMRYNHSLEYATNVLSWAAAYATGVMPTNPIPEPKRPVDKDKDKRKKKPTKPSTGTSTTPTAPEGTSPLPPSPQGTPPPACLGTICLPPQLVPQLPPQLLPPQMQPKPAPKSAPPGPTSCAPKPAPKPGVPPTPRAPKTCAPKPGAPKAGAPKPGAPRPGMPTTTPVPAARPGAAG